MSMYDPKTDNAGILTTMLSIKHYTDNADIYQRQCSAFSIILIMQGYHDNAQH